MSKKVSYSMTGMLRLIGKAIGIPWKVVWSGYSFKKRHPAAVKAECGWAEVDKADVRRVWSFSKTRRVACIGVSHWGWRDEHGFQTNAGDTDDEIWDSAVNSNIMWATCIILNLKKKSKINFNNILTLTHYI